MTKRYIPLFLLISACNTTAPLPVTQPPQVPAPSPSPAPAPAPSTIPAPAPIPVPAPVPAPAPIPAPVPSTPGSFISVPANADLLSAFAGFKPNTTYQLAHGAKYALKATVTVSQPNVHLDLNGSDMAMDVSPGASSNIAVRAAGFEMFNGSISKGVGGIRSWADHTYIHDLTFAGLTQQFFMGDRGSTNALLERITQKQATGSVTIYWVADNMTIKDSHLEFGSIGEYVLRQEIDDKGKIPTGAVIQNVVARNLQNAYHKQAIGIRMGSATFLNDTIDPDLRVGQGTAPGGLGSTVPTFVIKNCVFPTPHSPQLAIGAGVGMATIEGNTFVTDAATSSVSVDAMAKAVITNNVRKLATPSAVPKPRFWSTTANPPPSVVETGTKIVY